MPEKLTPAQNKALLKLSNTPKTAYDLEEQYNVLDELTRKGYAKKSGGGLGSAFSPATTFKYSLKGA